MTWLNQNATIFNSLLVYQLQLCEIRLWHYLRILLTYWRWMKTRTVSAMMIRIRQKEVFWRSLKNYTCTESKKDLATFNLLISNMYSLAFLPFSVLILFLTLTFFLSWTLSVSSFFFTFSPASAVQLASLKFFPLVKCWHTPDYAAMMDFNYLPFSPASYGPKVTLTDVGGLPWVGLPCKTDTFLC